MPEQSLTLLEALDRTPPVLARGMAVVRSKGHNGHVVRRKPMTQLLSESGLPRRTFQRLSYLPSWEDVSIGTASRFLMACGVNILKSKPTAEFLKGYGRHRLSFLTTRQRRKMDSVVREIRERRA